MTANAAPLHPRFDRHTAWWAALSIGAALFAALFAADVRAAGRDAEAPPLATATAPPKLDLSGRKRVGKASFYAGQFVGRKMADGTRMDPTRDNAASKTLPLGTVAKVTNLETGQSAVVTIKDRGPYRPGRIVDLTPATAHKVGITREQGVAPVEVTPIAVPMPDGGVKTGEAAGTVLVDAGVLPVPRRP